MPILDALDALEDMDIAKAHSKVLAIPIWEGQLMISLRMTEDEYIRIPKEERARKLVAMKLSDWLQLLEFVLKESEK